jgi:hypothetical protein
MENLVSPKMSSLAFDEMQEQSMQEYAPEFKIVNARNRSNEFSKPSATDDDVVTVSGKFTVSF